MTYDDFVRFALELPDTSETVGKGGPGVNRADRAMFWLKKWELLCIRVSWDVHDRLLDEHPTVIYKTPHFDTYPAVHADLDLLDEPLARELVRIAWEAAPEKIKYRKSSTHSP